MNRRDFIRSCAILVVFIWLTMATMPYRLAIIQNSLGHYYDENMAFQELSIRKEQTKLTKAKNVPQEVRWDSDEDLAKVLWATFKAPQAADILTDIKRQREKAYKDYNPKLINTMLLLAGAFRDVNRLGDSAAIYEQIWNLDKKNRPSGDPCLTRDQINLAVSDYLRGDSEESEDKQKQYFHDCLKHIQLAQRLWHEEKNPDVAKLANLFFLKYLTCRSLGDETASKQAYGEMKFLNKQVKHICNPPRT